MQLTPFEEYMLLDNHKAYPMSCFIRLRFRGKFDGTLLRKCIQATLKSHPLLHCKVAEAGKNKYQWVSVENPNIFFEHDFPCKASGIDLFREVPVKINQWTVEDETFWLIELNHSASDAVGIFTFIEEILIEYAVASGNVGNAIERRKFDQTLLAERGKFGLNLRKWLRIWHRQLWGLTRAWKFLMNRPIPLVPFKPDLAATKPHELFPAFVSHCFSKDETKRIRERAKASDVTINDLLLYATFLAMQKSRRTWEIPTSRRGDCLRLAVAMNLRTEEMAQIPAANIVSMVFLDRDTDKPVDLFSIHREMQHIKRNNLGLAFIHGLTIYKKIFGDFRTMSNQSRCWTTGTVSNLGRLFGSCPILNEAGRIQIGEIELQEVNAVPPIRPQSVFGTCGKMYAGEFGITLQYDTAALDVDKATELLEAVCEFIQCDK
ncbi:MAG: hypothetical protein ACRC2T_08045 [Thermoguttaceae bacterium]